jgi:HEAT repeat protein
MIDHPDQRAAAIREREEKRQRAIRAHKESLAPVVAELRRAGYDVESLDALRRSGQKYESAIPVLLNWLPRLSSLDAKESIVRTLSVPWAKPSAGAVLLCEFDNAPKEAESFRWAIGNALEVVAVPPLQDKLIEIVTNKANGKAREMFVLALAKIREPRSVEILIKLLDDKQVAGHAVMALRKLRVPEALDYLEPFTRHPQNWIRNEARKAIANAMKAHPPKLGS